MKHFVVRLERNRCGHPLAGLLWERQFEKSSVGALLGQILIGNASSYTVTKGLFLSVYVNDINLAGKKQNIDPMWQVLNTQVDLGEPTSFLNHVYLRCTRRHCETRKHIVDNNRTMFESRLLRRTVLPWDAQDKQPMQYQLILK